MPPPPIFFRFGHALPINVRNPYSYYQTFILVFTFVCYTTYHLSRKPISVVKSVLHQNCTAIAEKQNWHLNSENATFCDWEPFDKKNYNELLGSLEYAYLFAYAVGMLVSGHLAERLNLRHYLGVGMLLSGITTALFGLGYYWNVHYIEFYLIVQIFGGVCQATGWPSVVTCIGNWFGKRKRGFIMGVWNSHTSIGNILGSIIAGLFVKYAWGLSFIVPGAIISLCGLFCLAMLIPYPTDVGLPPPHECDLEIMVESVTQSTVDIHEYPALSPNSSTTVQSPHRQQQEQQRQSYRRELMSSRESDSQPLLQAAGGGSLGDASAGMTASTVATNSYKLGQSTVSMASSDMGDRSAIGLLAALRIPGVIEYSLCLFFAKLVSYTFLYWLPNYIKHSSGLDSAQSAFMSTLFDLGGIIGGVLAGVVSDISGKRALACITMLLLAAPMLFIYQEFGDVNRTTSIALLMLTGSLVNGPYALITTAVSADLGTSSSVRGDSKALATVTAIIDGTGSMGAAMGPLLTGLIVSSGWQNVFYMLITADLLAMLLLCRLGYHEIKQFSGLQGSVTAYEDLNAD